MFDYYSSVNVDVFEELGDFFLLDVVGVVDVVVGGVEAEYYAFGRIVGVGRGKTEVGVFVKKTVRRVGFESFNKPVVLWAEFEQVLNRCVFLGYLGYIVAAQRFGNVVYKIVKQHLLVFSVQGNRVGDTRVNDVEGFENSLLYFVFLNLVVDGAVAVDAFEGFADGCGQDALDKL